MHRIVFALVLMMGWVGSVNATLIEKNFDISIDNSLIYSTTDNKGVLGEAFRFSSFTDPFVLNKGDKLLTRIDFDKPLLLEDLGTDYWSSTTDSILGTEPLSFIYWFINGESGTKSNADVRLNYTVTFDVLSGNLANQFISGGLSSGGGGTAVALSYRSNITENFLIINGLDIETNIDSYILNSIDGEYNLLEGRIHAGNIEVLSVPEPSALALKGLGLLAVPEPPALALMGLGLLGLFGVFRKKPRSPIV